MAVVGFSQRETNTFKSFFSRAAKRPPAYILQDEVIDADVLLVNSENKRAMSLVRNARLPGRVLLLGSNDGASGWALLRTPVRFLSLLRSLDSLMTQKSPTLNSENRFFASTLPSEAWQLQRFKPRASHISNNCAAIAWQVALGHTSILEPQIAFSPEFEASKSNSPEANIPLILPHIRSPAKAVTTSIDTHKLRNTRPSYITNFGRNDPLVPLTLKGNVLLVCQNLVEGRILLKRLKKYQLEIDWCREPSQAHNTMKVHSYRLVVVDRLSGNPDPFQICRLAKQTSETKNTPIVILLAPNPKSVDRLKATLAGADAYLSRSIGDSALHKILEQHNLINGCPAQI